MITHGCHDPVFCPVPRRTHYLPQGPLKQELQGVALHRTRRIDGVKVAGSPLLGAVLALRTATLPSAAAAARSRPVRRLLGVPDRGNGVSTCRCASGSERRRSRTRRGAGVVEALEPSTGVSGARQPCGPAGRPTAKDGGETGKSVCGPRPGTPVDAEVDLDVIWMPGGLLVTDRLERGFL